MIELDLGLIGFSAVCFNQTYWW